MIIVVVEIYKQKAGGTCVASITFAIRRHMLVGFADGKYTVMALAAFTENLLMIDKWYRDKCGN